MEETAVPDQPNMDLDSENILLDLAPEPTKQTESQKLSSDQYDMLSDYIGELAKSEREKPEEPFTYAEGVINPALNIPLGLQTAWEEVKALATRHSMMAQEKSLISRSLIPVLDWKESLGCIMVAQHHTWTPLPMLTSTCSMSSK